MLERTSAKTLKGDQYEITVARDSKIVTAPGLVMVTSSKPLVCEASRVTSALPAEQSRQLQVVA